ncbi:hypothetical protein EPL05_11300 [Mucilaginibacter gilvus]|uniref:Uncharacterized protein n=1 Tax=Mucilaginibacter gilvus TaxID=2305909 RepID=A0A444MPC2_9SPHI|nr:hypothetical protein EPL05_11300 [Mucilaginibacter gilvus]
MTGCFISAGTHGSLKEYKYAIKKEKLQQAIMKVIKSSSNIYRDTSLDKSSNPPTNSASSGDQSTGDNYYNDVENYVTIKITSGQEVNEYTFRYYGDEEDWKTSSNSEIFICYAFDKNHKGGSDCNGGVTKEMLKEFTDIFEKEFISKVDLELNLSHTGESH